MQSLWLILDEQLREPGGTTNFDLGGFWLIGRFLAVHSVKTRGLLWPTLRRLCFVFPYAFLSTPLHHRPLTEYSPNR
ncbi:hypothetical protein L6452_27746 [Arctium lappa]|uniref:Uncharacterized protein n=1 Tax=Arctium lappa TaxID=4217 RepID=A0ACB8ZX05_ARCLA|nr:hypothetical protein L6452_27746 [Arctium lappa]